jgi:hypothetical protein
LDTKRTILVPAGLLCLVTALAAAFAPRPAQAAGVLVVANASGQSNTIGEYNATTGATIQTPFITPPGNGGHSLAVDGSNHLFETNSVFMPPNGYQSTIGEYNATTGAAINTAFISGQGLTFRGAIALDGNHLFVTCGGNPGSTVAEYDATTGAMINANFINLNQGLQVAGSMAIDAANNHLFVVDYNDIREFDATTGATLNYYFAHADTPGPLAVDSHNHLFVGTNGVIEYNSITGAVINPNFITPTPASYPYGLALDDNNHLFLSRNDGNTTVGEYNATTGAAVSVDLINGQGLDQPGSIVFVNSVPEPSTFVLAGSGFLCLVVCRKYRRGTLG